MVGFFTASDFLKYAESLLKETRQVELMKESTNYTWLKSKHLQNGVAVSLEEFKPMILKMSPESCTAVAVKLDSLTEQSTSTDHILTTLKTLLQEQDNMQIMAATVRRAKETKYRNVKVHPILEGRQSTVSFVVNFDKK